MILTGPAIRAAIARGDITITPLIDNDGDSQIDQAGVTLHLHPTVLEDVEPTTAILAGGLSHERIIQHIALDGVTLRHRHGYRSTAPAPVWPTVMPPACPVLAALQQPRTLDDLRDALPGWRRTDLFRRLLALWDGGEAVVRYEDGVAVWSCAEVTP